MERVSGFVVVAEDIPNPMMGEVVLVGEKNLIGEVNRISGNRVFIQVYEDTGGLKYGDRVVALGRLLSAELGPGLLGQVYDGLQRPLEEIAKQADSFVKAGIRTRRLDHEKKWRFIPVDNPPRKVVGGEIIGKVEETMVVTHMILIPPNISGELVYLADEGDYTIVDQVAKIKDPQGRMLGVTMVHEWPVKTPRPFREKLDPEEPLITGVRIIDFMFPVAKGGTAAIPGPFGSGKTMTLQQISKQVDADVVIYTGCGERGNEMADLLEKFRSLTDLKSGRPLMERSIIIANTSNMPVAARESSIFLGVTLAEYFRDMGYNVVLIADSISRWAEALRELSSRMEELPGEEGFPAYLASRLQGFYSRAGKVTTLNGKTGSLTIMSAVSPPGGDFGEPVTQKTLQAVKVFWALDSELAYRRHFPAINWLQSYSLYIENIAFWWELNVSEGWRSIRENMLGILREEDELMQIVRLMGMGALSDRERAILETSRLIREAFLKQSALDFKDAYSDVRKTFAIAEIIDYYRQYLLEAVSNGIPLEKALGLNIGEEILRLKHLSSDELAGETTRLKERIISELSELQRPVEAQHG
ncbi:MAG: V-type ATP synthase subunit A [Candidatus Brockarchaeota archaeon]|nr:V-type ATP synthase subunit A [Candidatus Brockarchaeota archaeon]MBO3841768.1 V-type ATP synthase subunit A [Candidatus Brockarchaeota archaeon]